MAKKATISFSEQLRTAVRLALEYITEAATKRKKIVFYKGIPQGDEDEFYDLPTLSNVDKYYSYTQYGVLSIEKVDKDIILHTKGRTEGDEGLKDFKLTELSNENQAVICEIADLVKRTRKK